MRRSLFAGSRGSAGAGGWRKAALPPPLWKHQHRERSFDPPAIPASLLLVGNCVLAWIINDVCEPGVSAGAGCGSRGVLAAGQSRACVLEPDPDAIKNALLSCFF